MNKTQDIILLIENETEFEFLYENEFEQILKNLKTYFNIQKSIEVDVTITDNKTIRELNKEYRGKDYATDILSFDFADSQLYEFLPIRHLGELVISYEKVVFQAQEFNHSVKREICYLFTHGLIHLMGYDHEEEDERKEMNSIVDTIFNPLNISREE